MQETPAPFFHDLALLAKRAELVLASEQQNDLKTISEFNIATRYPDDRFKLYKRATDSFTKTYLRKTSIYRLWFKKLLKEQNS